MNDYLDKDTALKYIYETYGITNSVCLNHVYVKVEDLDRITSNELSYNVYDLIHYDLDSNKVEVFNKYNIPKSDFYVKIPLSISVFKENDLLFTIEKINKYEILNIYYMQTLKDFVEDIQLYETLLKSLESEKFEDLLNRFFNQNDNKITIPIKSKSIKHDSIEIITSTSLKGTVIWNELEKLSNVAGYKIFESQRNENEYHIVFTPYHADNANNIVYDKFNGIVYHLTSKYFYDKIKVKQTIPFRTEFGWEGKSRLYVFSGNINSDEFDKEVCSFKRLSIMQAKLFAPRKLSKYYDKNILLEIDLNRIENKFNFFFDPAYKSKIYPVYTMDNIPVDCITKIYKVNNKNIDKDNYETIRT